MSATFDFSALETGFAADWPVFVNVPQDGGTFVRQEFTARFRSFTKTELEELVEKYPNDPHIIYRSALVGLGKAAGPEFTTELRDLMLDTRHVREGLQAAYETFCSGVEAKN